MEKVEKIKGIIADQLGVRLKEIVPEADFENDLGADSLDRVELCMALEEEFDIEITEEEQENIDTVKDLMEFVKSKIEK